MLCHSAFWYIHGAVLFHHSVINVLVAKNTVWLIRFVVTIHRECAFNTSLIVWNFQNAAGLFIKLHHIYILVLHTIRSVTVWHANLTSSRLSCIHITSIFNTSAIHLDIINIQEIEIDDFENKPCIFVLVLSISSLHSNLHRSDLPGVTFEVWKFCWYFLIINYYILACMCDVEFVNKNPLLFLKFINNRFVLV